jgi:hypothetical protein
VTNRRFISTPIIAPTERDAREILGRTYQADRFKLTRHSKILFVNGKGWRFNVILKKTGGK